MSAAYVHGRYQVPAKRGKPAKIVGFRGAHLRPRIDGEKHIVSAHPTWEITYPEGTKK